MSLFVAGRIIARGEVPYLHAYAANSVAIALYEFDRLRTEASDERGRRAASRVGDPVATAEGGGLGRCSALHHAFHQALEEEPLGEGEGDDAGRDDDDVDGGEVRPGPLALPALGARRAPPAWCAPPRRR